MIPWFAVRPFFHVFDFSLIKTYHMIRFEKDTRYYSMHIKKDLLDDWVIVVINGRIQTKLGQVRTLAFTCFSDAFDHFCEMIQVRLKRDYHLKSYQGGNSLLITLLAYAPINAIADQIPALISPMKNTKAPTNATPKITIHSVPVQMGFSF